MTPQQIQTTLKSALPKHRWLIEPIATTPTVTAKLDDQKTIGVSFKGSSFEITFTDGRDRPWAGWTDARPLEQILPILKIHAEWFSPPSSPTARPANATTTTHRRR